jgi:5,10-methylenetetrahydromethanopterin reductase
MPARIGVSYEGGHAPQTLREIVETADELGVGTLWAASHLFLREPIANAAMVLAHTKRLGAALMAMSPYTVHPVYATMAAAALDEWFPGRVQLCFGSGAPRDLESVGLIAERPLERLSESIAIARDLLGGEAVVFEGQHFQIKGRRLASGRRDIPLILAASRPKMLELAGAIADGVLISAGTSPAFVSWALDHVRAGEGRRGRCVRKSALVYASVDSDAHVARNALRRNLGIILRGEHHAHNLMVTGTSLDQRALTAAFGREDFHAVDVLVNDDVVANHTMSGTPTHVKAMMRNYEAVGLDDIILAGIGSAAMLRAIMAALARVPACPCQN